MDNSFDRFKGGITPDEQVPTSVIKLAAKVAFEAVKIYGSEEKLDEASFSIAFVLGANWRSAGCPGILGVMAAAIDDGGTVNVERVKGSVERIKSAPPEQNEAELLELSKRERSLIDSMRGKSGGEWGGYKDEN